jgi:CysZ protein
VTDGGAGRRNPLREAAAGVGDLLRGFRVWGTSPRLMLLGAIPALVVGTVFLGLLIGLIAVLPALAAWATPFADAWPATLRDSLRVVVGAAVLVLAVLLLVLGYTAATLTVGDPFYERISRRVEERLGGAPPERNEPMLRGVGRALGDGVRLFLAGLLVAIAAFLLGLIPVAGPVLAAIVGAAAGGWLLAVELTGFAFDARGHRLRERRRALRGRRARSWGFGVATYLLFLVPFVAVAAMPAAVAGATLLSRAVLDQLPGRAEP